MEPQDEKEHDGHALARQESKRDRYRSSIIVVALLVFSLVVAAFLKDFGTESLPSQFRYISAAIGWLYFAAWSVSFYPQAILNCSRRSTVGMSQDYQLYNLIGFFSYSVFNCAFFFNDTIQEEYRKANNGHENQVQVNDVFFSLHALLLTVVIIIQIFVFDRKVKVAAGKITLFAAVLTGVTFLVIIIYAILILAGIQAGGVFTWLTWLYLLSYVKLGVTLVKYIPQAYLNWYRGTTDGFNMHNVLLDFTGGSLSVAQLVLDSAATDDWSAVTGDLAKFMLGFVSMVFDTVYMLQHYCCFHERNRHLYQQRLVLEKKHGAQEASRLLAEQEIESLASTRSGFRLAPSADSSAGAGAGAKEDDRQLLLSEPEAVSAEGGKV